MGGSGGNRAGDEGGGWPAHLDSLLQCKARSGTRRGAAAHAERRGKRWGRKTNTCAVRGTPQEVPWAGYAPPGTHALR